MFGDVVKSGLVLKFTTFILAVLVFWYAFERLEPGQKPVSESSLSTPESQAPEPLPSPQVAPDKFVADISVHTLEELERLFSRVEQVMGTPRTDGEQPLISLVLHGPEVEFFALKNYGQYKPVVDTAAKLAALGAVTISICQTQMRNYDLAPNEVPAFLRQVPFGPDEVQRLVGEGYVTM